MSDKRGRGQRGNANFEGEERNFFMVDFMHCYNKVTNVAKNVFKN